MTEYETQALVVREKMARRKALRLAKEAREKSEPAAERRTARRKK